MLLNRLLPTDNQEREEEKRATASRVVQGYIMQSIEQ